jgi:CheY-like chemotaxis protein
MNNAKKMTPDRHRLINSFNAIEDTIDYMINEFPILQTEPEIMKALQRNVQTVSKCIKGDAPQNILAYPSNFRKKASSPSINFKIKTIVIVEDEEIFFKHWQVSSDKYHFKFYTSPENLLTEINKNELDLDQVGCFILDMNFGRESKYDGIELCEIIKTETSSPVLLASSYIDTEDKRLKVFDYIYEKKHLDIEILTKLFKE